MLLTLPQTRTRARTIITVLAEWTSNTRGINIPLNIPLAGLSSLKPREVSCYFVFWWQQQPTRGGKSKKGGDSWLTSCTIIFRHHRERTREAAAAGARTNGYAAHLTSFSAVKRHIKRGTEKRHVAVDYTPGY